jgi:hypothetical protein
MSIAAFHTGQIIVRQGSVVRVLDSTPPPLGATARVEILRAYHHTEVGQTVEVPWRNLRLSAKAEITEDLINDAFLTELARATAKNPLPGAEALAYRAAAEPGFIPASLRKGGDPDMAKATRRAIKSLREGCVLEPGKSGVVTGLELTRIGWRWLALRQPGGYHGPPGDTSEAFKKGWELHVRQRIAHARPDKAKPPGDTEQARGYRACENAYRDAEEPAGQDS